MRRLGILVAWLVLLGCRAPAHRRAPVAESNARGVEYDADFLVQLVIRAVTSAGTTTLPQHGGTLRSGDWFWLDLRLSMPAHVYVVQVVDGRSSVLYPRDDRPKLPAGELRVPQRGRFRLDTHPGTEFLVVIVSRHPLAQVDRSEALRALLVKDSAVGSPRVESSYPSRVEVTARPRSTGGARLRRIYTPDVSRDTREAQTRGVLYEVEHTDATWEIRGVPDESGLVVIPISLLHLDPGAPGT